MPLRSKVIVVLVASCLLGATAILITPGGWPGKDGDGQELVFDLAVDDLTDMARGADVLDMGKRAKVALAKLKNGVPDPEPILISSVIGRPEGMGPLLNVVCFDEERDLRGLRVKEQYVDPNGKTTTLEEDYPVFVNALRPFILECVAYPIHIRDKGQRKDKCLWLEYANWNLDGLIRLYVDERQDNGKEPSPREVPKVETPPIYISVPDPNRVQVLMSAYDRAGHESESIQLLAPPPGKFYKSEYVPRRSGRRDL
jgi:hypothetical protein